MRPSGKASVETDILEASDQFDKIEAWIELTDTGPWQVRCQRRHFM